LCGKFKDASEIATAGVNTARDFSKPAKFVVKYVDAVCKVIESEPVEYFAKVSYSYVKKLSLERSRRLSDALEMMLVNFPSAVDATCTSDLMAEPGVRHLIKSIETFFLSDHVVEEGKEIPDYLKVSKHKHHNHHSKDKPNKPSPASASTSAPRAANATTSNSTSAPDSPTPTTATKSTSTASPSAVSTTPPTSSPNRNQNSSNNSRPPSSISMKSRRSLVLRQKDSAILKQMGSIRGGLTLEEDDADGSISVRSKGSSSANSKSKKGRSRIFRRGAGRGKGGTGNASDASKSATSKGGLSMVFAGPLLAIVLLGLKQAQLAVIRMDADYAFLVCFVCFALGVQLGNTFGLGKQAATCDSQTAADPKRSGSMEASNTNSNRGGVKFSESTELKLAARSSSRSLALLRKSMSRTMLMQPQPQISTSTSLEDQDVDEDEDEDGVLVEGGEEVRNNDNDSNGDNGNSGGRGDEDGHDDDDDSDEQSPRALIQSPLRTFPLNGEHADPEENLNCVSQAPHAEFPVRGAKYLTDHKKVPSGPMLFPCRGSDLLLTDECPENVGR
jgi:hypothetical protein